MLERLTLTQVVQEFIFMISYFHRPNAQVQYSNKRPKAVM
jgi:hypothetical protein